jgi:uncharacterized protein
VNDRTDQICDEKILKLKARLKKLKTAAVAFSGGVDSAFLLAVAARSGLERLMAVTVDSAFVTREEIQRARQTAADLGVMHQLLAVDILGHEQVAANSPERCYHCKTVVFSLIRKAADQAGISHVLHGVNTDDLSDYRPGLRAAEDLGFLAPLLKAGFSKHQIRTCSRQMGLTIWNLPSQSCLATRIPFLDTITRQALAALKRRNSSSGLWDLPMSGCGAMGNWPASKPMRLLLKPWPRIGNRYHRLSRESGSGS